MTSPFLLMSKGTIVCWWNPDCRCSSSPVLLGSTAQYLHIYGSFQTIILHPHPRPSTRARKWKAPPNLQSPEPQYLTECSPTWGKSPDSWKFSRCQDRTHQGLEREHQTYPGFSGFVWTCGNIPMKTEDLVRIALMSPREFLEWGEQKLYP